MALNSSDRITATTTDDLATVHVAKLQNGVRAWVESVQNNFYLDKTSGVAADGITIVKPNIGSAITGVQAARWIRDTSELSPIFQDQTEWHINEETGNDNFRGDTAEKPLKTYDEFRRRVGHIITNVKFVFFDSDINGDINAIFHLEAGTAVIHVGFRTEIRSGTVTAVTPYDPANNIAGEFTDASLPGTWTDLGLVGQLIELTGRPDQAAGWTAKDQGAKTVRYSPFFDFSTGVNTDPIVGEPYTVWRLPKINGLVNQVVSGFGDIEFDDLEIGLGGDSGNFCFIRDGGIGFLGFCKLAGSLGASAYISNGGQGEVHGLFVSSVQNETPDTFCNRTEMISCLLLNSFATIHQRAELTFFLNNLIQGGPDFVFGIVAHKDGQVRLGDLSEIPFVDMVGMFDMEFGYIAGPGSHCDMGNGRLYGSVNQTGVILDSCSDICILHAPDFFVYIPNRLNIAAPNEALIGSIGTTYALIEAAIAADGSVADVAKDARVTATLLPF